MPIPLPILRRTRRRPCALAHLDDLWFQVAGTLCNLTCRHCFISCSPHNHSFGFLDLDTVRRVLDESVALGVKEYYFTGGEPFLNRDMAAILELTLRYGPATVLTNGTVFKDEWLERLARAEAASPYSLEFRVSIDGFTAADQRPGPRRRHLRPRPARRAAAGCATASCRSSPWRAPTTTRTTRRCSRGFVRAAAAQRLRPAARQDPADAAPRGGGGRGSAATATRSASRRR